MSNSPADIIRWLLVEMGLGSDPTLRPLVAWPVYATNEPGMPDNVVTVYDTTGLDHGRSMLDGEILYHYGFQVRVRALDHSAGWTQADSLRSAMATGIYAAVVTIGANSFLVYNIAHIGEVLPLGVDTPNTKRSLFTINAVAAIRQL